MAGLPRQVVPIPFGQGVSTKEDSKQVPLGKLLTLENGFFQTPQEIRKRYGFEQFGSTSIFKANTTSPATSTISSGKMLQAYANELLESNGTNIFSYDDSLNKWSNRGAFCPLKITTQIVNGAITSNQSSPVNQIGQQCAYDATSGLTCIVYQSSVGNLYFTITDSTGQKIVNAKAVSPTSQGTQCRVVYFQNNFLIIYADGSANLGYTKIPTATPYSATHATIATNLNATSSKKNFDATVIGSRLYVAYNYTTTGISIVYLDSSFVVSSETHNTSHAADGTICIWGTISSNVAICLSDNTTCWIIAYDSNISSITSAYSNIIGLANVNQLGGVHVSAAIDLSSDVDLVTYCVNPVSPSTNTHTGIITYDFVSRSTSNNSPDYLTCVSLLTKPIVYGGNAFFATIYGAGTTVQPTIFIYMLDISNTGWSATTNAGVLIGKMAAAEAYYDSTTVTSLGELQQISSGIYAFAYGQYSGGAEVASAGSTMLAALDFTVTPQSAQLANTLHITGGHLWMYDSINVVEHGFHLYPDNLSDSITATGSIIAGSYQYIAVYEWLDAQGQLHRSAPSIPLAVTVSVGGASQIAVTVACLRATMKLSTVYPVTIVLFRTAANGTIFYKTASGVNDPTANTITINDTTVDATLVGNIELYTTGGQVENSSAPPCMALSTYKSRLIVVPSDNPFSWWFSQEVIPNSAASAATPVELSEFFIQNIDQDGGPLTSVGVMDDKLVFFKGQIPYYIVGNGPAANGTGNDYSPPQRITCPVGAVSPASVVMTPMGLMFQASNSAGIWLLDRALGPNYIGADVEVYNSQNVTSAVLYPQFNQVRFTMSGGVCLAYDYFVKQWTVLTGIAAVQACIFQGQYTYTKSTGSVLQESTSLFTDNGTFVQLKVGTSWMKFAGLQGFQRVYEVLILGDYETAHSLVAKVYYDFDPAVAQTTTIAPTSTAPYQWRLLFNRQKCEAMKIELYDTQDSPAEGMRLSSLAIWVGVKYGLNKMAASRTFE